MWDGFFNLIRRLYWRWNRGFLAAFAEAVIGESPGGLRADGPRVIAEVERVLGKIPVNAYQQTTLALMLFPLAVPARLPRSNVLRFWVKLGSAFKGNLLRRRFIASSKEQRAAWLDRIYARLSRQAAEQEDDLVKMVVVLNTIKALICACFVETEEVWWQIGYSPYPTPPRDWQAPSGPKVENPPRTATGEFLHRNVESARSVANKVPDRMNYCIIGSGAGGAMAALFIQKNDPDARILLLEEGPLITNEAFPVRLVEASTALYMNAGSTLSKNQKYAFQQGRCVGGSTTVNNGVAFRPEGFWWRENIVARWKALGAELDFDRLYRAYDDIIPFINVRPVEDRVLTPMSRLVADGFRRTGYAAHTHPVPVNTFECLGCGRCNAGCQYDAKQSMLVTAIPEFVRRGGHLVPNAKVERIEYEAVGNSLAARAAIVATPQGEMVRVEADRFVVAAGAYASTKLLWKSGFTGLEPGVRTVGKRFTGNMGSPVIGRFADALNGWAGQQVGFAIELPEQRTVIETAFAPPGVIGLLAPQWGDSFATLIEDYSRLAIAVPVLASMAYGEIDRGILPTVGWLMDYRFGGFVIDYEMGVEDWLRLESAMKLCARALFEMGATEIFTTRFDARSLARGGSIERYFEGTGPLDYLKVQTAHLHGGNVIHEDPRQGVVDSECKVYGFQNLWICDGSVIPAAITLNLQLTIMAMARYAADSITADRVSRSLVASVQE